MYMWMVESWLRTNVYSEYLVFGIFFFLFILAHKRVTNTHSVSGLHKYKHNGFNVDFRLRENERIPRQSAIIFDFIATVNPIARACIFFTFYILSIGHEFGTEFFIMLVYIFFFHLLLFVSFDRAQRNVSKYGNLQMFQTTHGPFTVAPNKYRTENYFVFLAFEMRLMMNGPANKKKMNKEREIEKKNKQLMKSNRINNHFCLTFLNAIRCGKEQYWI